MKLTTIYSILLLLIMMLFKKKRLEKEKAKLNSEDWPLLLKNLD